MSITDALPCSLLIRGDAVHAFRDPTAFYHNGVFYLYCTYVETEESGDIFMYTVSMKSTDLIHWSTPERLTPRNKSLNYSSPGNIVLHDGKYVMCLQTYCRENGEKYGNQNSRLFTMTSADLEHWEEPQLLPVKGNIPPENMGRMIDPYLIFDRQTGRWNCFYKQNGVSRSDSPDFLNWNYCGNISGGENVSIVEKDGGYYMFHSPQNGIGIKYSEDLSHWTDIGSLLTFGQDEWEWAKGRLTAGFVLPYEEDGHTIYLMFFHGTGPEDEQTIFDTHACIGLAWSDDLLHWNWR